MRARWLPGPRPCPGQLADRHRTSGPRCFSAGARAHEGRDRCRSAPVLANCVKSLSHASEGTVMIVGVEQLAIAAGHDTTRAAVLHSGRAHGVFPIVTALPRPQLPL